MRIIILMIMIMITGIGGVVTSAHQNLAKQQRCSTPMQNLRSTSPHHYAVPWSKCSGFAHGSRARTPTMRRNTYPHGSKQGIAPAEYKRVQRRGQKSRPMISPTRRSYRWTATPFIVRMMGFSRTASQNIHTPNGIPRRQLRWQFPTSRYHPGHVRQKSESSPPLAQAARTW